MKRLIIAAGIATAAVASGCATFDSEHYARNDDDAYRRSMVAPATAVANPSYPVADGDNAATPYREPSMFFKDRGLHQDVPSALNPHVVVPPAVVPPAG